MTWHGGRMWRLPHGTEVVTVMDAGEHTVTRLVLFGATGDLAGRFLFPALFELAHRGVLPQGFAMTASSTSDLDDDGFRAHVTQALRGRIPDEHAESATWVLERTRYLSADATDAESVGRVLRAAREGQDIALGCYLALPPAFVPGALESLVASGLPSGSRVAVEKPFGDDLRSAHELAALIQRLFGADADTTVFNVDHSLGMAPVQGLLPLRRANVFPEAVWNAQQIEEVRVLWEEALGLEDRAGFYDATGALKDVMQNHMMQVLAQATMELPDQTPEGMPELASLHARRSALLEAVQVPSAEDAARNSSRARYTAGELTGDGRSHAGPVPDYVDEGGIDPDRGTETFAEVLLHIDTPRWSGARIRLRAGKALRRRRKGIEIVFRTTTPGREPAVLWIGLDGELDVRLELNTRQADGELERLELRGRQPAPDFGAYAHVLRDFLNGGSALAVATADAIRAWKILTPVIESWGRGEPPMQEYEAGSDGPPMIDAG